jgi:hypothetical protein
LYMLLLWMLLSKVGMNLTHDWTSTHETMQCPISISQKAYSGWKSVRKKCTAFDIRQEWGTHYWLQASLKVGKHTMRENIGVIGNYGMLIYLDWTGHCVVYMPVFYSLEKFYYFFAIWCQILY